MPSWYLGHDNVSFLVLFKENVNSAQEFVKKKHFESYCQVELN